MSIGDGLSGLGPTRHKWVPEVSDVVHRTLNHVPNITANTYLCHPWCGWGRWSVDFWGPGGRGDPIPDHKADAARHFLLNLNGPPFVRHWIYQHTLWTSFGGYSAWTRDDHSGKLRHFHVTYWRN